jgi:hypothetical protein
MQICQDHWHELKNAIRQRGLWTLVAHDGYIAAPLVTRDQYENSDAPTLDPLVTAGLMISDQALRAFGSYLLTRSYCPLCEVEQNLGQGTSLEWIEADADSVLHLCQERQLIGLEEF